MKPLSLFRFLLSFPTTKYKHAQGSDGFPPFEICPAAQDLKTFSMWPTPEFLCPAPVPRTHSVSGTLT